MSCWPSRGMGCAAVFLLLSACADQHAPASRQPTLASTESPPALVGDHHQESARDHDSGGELITLPPASEPLTLTRDQALNLLLAHNPELRHRRLEPEVARAAERAEAGRFGAYVDGEFRFDRQRITTRARSTGRGGDDDLLPQPPSAEDIIRELQADSRRIRADISQDFSGQFAVRQPLASGGEVALIAEGLSQQQGEDARTYDTGLALRLDQPLLAGAGSTVARSSVRLAGLVAEASEHEFRAWLQELVARGERAYWQVVRAQAAIGAVESSLAVALQQQEETRQRIERGALSPSEAAVSDTEVALRRQALIDAQAELRSAQLRLQYLIDPQPQSRDITAVSKPLDAEGAPSFAEAESIEHAQRLRSELREAELLIKQRRLQTVVSEDGLLPRLDFFATIGTSAYARSVQQSVDAWGDEFEASVGVSFRHSLRNARARGEFAGARFQEQQARAALDSLRLLIVRDVRLAHIEVERARAQLQATAASNTLRQQVLDNERRRLRAGTTTSLQVALAARDALQSEIDEITARVDFQLSLIELHLADGSLLERRGISIDPGD